MSEQPFSPGDIVYVIVRNPHAQSVAHVQQAAVVRHPEQPQSLALFSHETYYELSDELAVFKSESEAEQQYNEAFGTAVDLVDNASGSNEVFDANKPFDANEAFGTETAVDRAEDGGLV